MRFPDYGKCQIRTIFLARELKKQGLATNVLYGIYTPTTLRTSWDERWQHSPVGEFAHFWLGVDHIYYDYSAFQFGEIERVKTSCKDTRYNQLGYYDQETKKLINTGNLMIEWESPYEDGGVPILKLVPIFV